MMRKAKIILTLGLVGIFFLPLCTFTVFAAPKVIKIGITQIVEHPALNAVRDGFIDAMADQGYVEGENVVYDKLNAQGDMATANTIARKFVSEKVDMILSIATPTSMAAVNATSTIPIVFSAVTDPLSAGLVKDLKHSGNNVTGISDLTPVKRQIQLIKELFPEAKTVGTLYNASEVNSVTTNDLAKKACQELGMKLLEATVSSSADVYLAAQSLAGRVDAIYVSTDNTVVSALDAVVQVTNKYKIPLVLADPTTIGKGALVALGFNYYEHGRQAADIAIKVLKGTKPGDIPVEFAKNLELRINMDTVVRIASSAPEEILNGCMSFYEKLKEEGAQLTIETVVSK